MRRSLLALALVTLVLLAGCQIGGTTQTQAAEPGGSPDATPTPTASPTPTPTPSPTPTATPTPTPDSLADHSYPDGANESGFDNVSAIVTAGATLLNDTSYTLRIEERTTGPDGTTDVTRFVGREGDDDSYTDITHTAPDENDTAIWVQGETINLRQESDVRTAHTYYGPDGALFRSLLTRYNLLLASLYPSQMLKAFHYEAVDAYPEGGADYVVYQSTGVNETYVSGEGNTEYVGGNLTVTVRDDGVVTSIQGTTEEKNDAGGTVTTEVSFTLEAIGETSPEEPGWVSDEVTRIEATTLDDGRVVKLTHAGGPAVTGANVTLSLGIIQKGTVTDVDLAPGDTVYLTATGGEDAFSLNATVSRSRPTPGDDAVVLTDDEDVFVTVTTTGYEGRVAAYVNETAD